MNKGNKGVHNKDSLLKPQASSRKQSGTKVQPAAANKEPKPPLENTKGAHTWNGKI